MGHCCPTKCMSFLPEEKNEVLLKLNSTPPKEDTWDLKGHYAKG